MATLPTLYEHYTEGGISAGLSTNQTYFTLNNKNVTLYSGAMHYFRVPQEHWRDRLRKMRAAGLNAVETYVPWNLHEPQPGVYDFGQGGTDYQDLLDIEKFLQIAQEEDLFAIVRPGPYICSEWEFGGLPSWLLREKDIKVRTSDRKFMNHVERYFKVLLTMLSFLQFTKGGPIVAFQIENEYGNVKNGDQPVDGKYLEDLKKMFISNGIVELLFTSDTPSFGFSGAINGTLATANFQNHAPKELKILQDYQPDKPLMVMEFWAGWFDHWTEKHQTRSNSDFSKTLESILSYPASVNFYMFHGGSNWGFLNGANIFDDNFLYRLVGMNGYKPDTSSYDYDAPLSESGDYTDKYFSAKAIIAQHNKIQTRLPKLPELKPRIAYPQLKITEYMGMNAIVAQVPHHIQSEHLISMEDLPINNNTGQQYGYVVYRKKGVTFTANSVLKIHGNVYDAAFVLLNGKLVSKAVDTFGDFSDSPYWGYKDYVLKLGPEAYQDATLDIVVENCGRNNFGTLDLFDQRKGLYEGPVSINDIKLKDFEIVPLEFRKSWTLALKNWKSFECGQQWQPGLYRATLNIANVTDTFVDTRGWKKGIVIVNGFVLSKYFKLGPQQTAYLPGPFLKEGENEIIFFEHFMPSCHVNFVTDPVYDSPNVVYIYITLLVGVISLCFTCLWPRASKVSSKKGRIRLFKLGMLLLFFVCVWYLWKNALTEVFLIPFFLP